MAQVLKKESKDAIIKASKEEFLEYGYKDASMRRIAKKSNMTVGNLYRYFKSKEDISLIIVGETLKQIEECLDSITKSNVSLEKRVYNVNYNVSDFRRLLDNLADKLVDIYIGHKEEFNILMNDSNLNEKIITWLNDSIRNIIFQNYTVDEYQKQVEYISHAYSISIFNGIKDLFYRVDVSAESLKNMIKIFFRGFIVILQADIGQIIG